jgi:hypothetical protein
MITWRNKTATTLNAAVRPKIFGENPALIEPGEQLTGAATLTVGRSVPIKNSKNYRVLGATYVTKDNGIKGWNVVLRFEEDRKIQEEGRFIVDTSDKDSVDRLIALDKEAIDAVKSSTAIYPDFTPYYEFRANYINIQKINTPSGQRDMLPYLGYGYAGTIHKAQGGTFQHVFVHEDDIDANQKVYERNRIKYTALTRPARTATVYTHRQIQPGNSFVDESSRIPDNLEPGGRTNPFGESAPLTDEDGLIIDGFLGTPVTNDLGREANQIVSDEELDEFIKKCKGE